VPRPCQAAQTRNYEPLTPADWGGAPPLSVAEALDRLAGTIVSVGLAFRAVAFAYNTPSPLVLPDAIGAGRRVTRAGVVITQTFNDPLAELELGTAATPALLLGAADSDPGATGQYETQELRAGTGAALELEIAPGASTQGAGIVFYEWSE
jgi:hypothetical protein